MDLDFLRRIWQATAVVGVVVFAFVAVYYDAMFALGILTGCAWGVANFIALSALLTAVIRPGGEVLRRRAIILAAVKFPALYLAGYVLLRSGWFEPVALLTGFSLLFFVTLLKALGRVYLRMDERRAALRRADGTRLDTHLPLASLQGDSLRSQHT